MQECFTSSTYDIICKDSARCKGKSKVKKTKPICAKPKKENKHERINRFSGNIGHVTKMLCALDKKC